MANGGLYSSLKEIIYAMYDSSMNLRVHFVGVLAKKEIDQRRIDLLKDIIDLVLNTDLTSEYTKIYLRDKNMTTSGVADKVNETIIQTGEFIEKKSDGIIYKCKQNSVTPQIINSRLMYEQRKLDAEFGKNVIARIAFMKTSDISEYEIRVKRLLEKYKTGANIRDNLDLKIESDKYCETYSGDFIKEYGELLYTYLKLTKSSVEKMLNSNKEFVGYFNYLLSGVNTDNEKVLADREFLCRLLSGEPTEFSKINIEEVEKTPEVKRKRGRPRKQSAVKIIKTHKKESEQTIDENKQGIIEDKQDRLEDEQDRLEADIHSTTKDEQYIDNNNQIEENSNNIDDKQEQSNEKDKQSLIDQFSLVKKPNTEETNDESTEEIEEDIDEDFYSSDSLDNDENKEIEKTDNKVEDSIKNDNKSHNDEDITMKNGQSTYRMQF